MDVTGIAALATAMSQARLQQEVSMTVLKKALDQQGTTALALIEALPAVQSAANLPAHLGQTVNTTA